MADAQPVLATTHGPIKGHRCTGLYGASYYSFEGIPFAKPPVGELRFRAPQPPTPWTQVLDCFAPRSKPTQKDMFTGEIEGSEDCLYLNVYVKEMNTSKPLPVLIYIYGGGFQNGGANRETYGPDYFMEHDVVLVSLNYRLGALGFLSLQDPTLHIPGNAGLKDQCAAMRWFHANCALFNGDPNNITLFGNSAGSVSTNYQMLNSNAKGLFHRAILQSGTTHNPWALSPYGDYAYRLAQRLGYTGENTDKAVYEYILNAPSSKIMNEDVLSMEDRIKDIHYTFGPVVEPYIEKDCVLPALPTEIVKTSWSNDIPLILGGVTFEGLVRYQRTKQDPKIKTAFKLQPEMALPYDVRITKENAKELGAQFVEQHNAHTDDDDIMGLLDLFSYKAFWLGYGRTILERLLYATAPTYLYRFNFDSLHFNFHRLKYCGKSERGVSHGDELGYLFHCAQAKKLEESSDEYKIIKRMVGLWTSFAKESNPNCDHIAPVLWHPLATETPFHCLNIEVEVEMCEYPEIEKLQNWLSLYDLNQQYDTSN